MKTVGTGAKHYALTSDKYVTDEGTDVTITLATENVPDGTVVTYNITGVSSDDLVGGSLTGTMTIISNIATQVVSIKNDYITEGEETMVFTIVGEGAAPGSQVTRSVSVVINDTSEDAYGWVWRAPGEYQVVLPAGDWVMVAAGGGGAGASGRGGSGGWIPARISTSAETTVKVGVGAAQINYTATGSASTYMMKGGTGGSNAGAGGSGSYISVSNPTAVPRSYPVNGGQDNLILVAGGGGGSANHSFTANYGGTGYGYGGAAYSASWPNDLHPYAGDHGFNSTGAGGNAQSNGRDGGSANIVNQMNGGNGGADSQSGGGGGGGAGGGGGGAGGLATPGNGGYFNIQTQLVEFNPRGGGGGGSHGNRCGGTAGGGGSLLYTDYRFGTIFSNTVGNAEQQLAANQPYYSEIQSYIQTYLSSTLWNLLQTKGQGGSQGNGLGQNGFVMIVSADAVLGTTVNVVN